MNTKKTLLITLLGILFTISSCTKEEDLFDSQFISDDANPGLPVYSEWGYNTFGAYYDRATFTSTSIDVPLKIINKDDATSFIFQGEVSGKVAMIDDGSYYNYGRRIMSIMFKFPHSKYDDLDFNVYTSLIDLNQRRLILNEDLCDIEVKVNEEIVPASLIGGELLFIRAQNLLVDKKQTAVILSGVFHFNIEVNSVPVSVSQGRFDVAVAENIFFKY